MVGWSSVWVGEGDRLIEQYLNEYLGWPALSLTPLSQTGVTRKYSLYFIERQLSYILTLATKSVEMQAAFIYSTDLRTASMFSGSGYGNRVSCGVIVIQCCGVSPSTQYVHVVATMPVRVPIGHGIGN